MPLGAATGEEALAFQPVHLAKIFCIKCCLIKPPNNCARCLGSREGSIPMCIHHLGVQFVCPAADLHPTAHRSPVPLPGSLLWLLSSPQPMALLPSAAQKDGHLPTSLPMGISPSVAEDPVGRARSPSALYPCPTAVPSSHLLGRRPLES